MSLGVKARGESFRIHLTIHGDAPTGTPQITIKGPLYRTDLATDVLGTTVTGGEFEADMVNGYLHILSGVGFTAGSYKIVAFVGASQITIQSSAGVNASLGSGIINDATVLAASNMTQGASNLIWYYDYITEYGAADGQHQVIMSAVINGVTYYAVDDYTVSAEASLSSGNSDIEYENDYD